MRHRTLPSHLALALAPTLGMAPLPPKKKDPLCANSVSNFRVASYAAGAGVAGFVVGALLKHPLVGAALGGVGGLVWGVSQDMKICPQRFGDDT